MKDNYILAITDMAYVITEVFVKDLKELGANEEVLYYLNKANDYLFMAIGSDDEDIMKAEIKVDNQE